MGETGVALAEWRRDTSRLAAEVAADWELTLGEPYAPGAAGHVVAGFRPLAEEAEHWREGGDLGAMPGGRLRDAAASYLRELGPSQGEQVLLHLDLHGDNVLSAEREPWVAIDRKPLCGEREFAAAPIVRSFELGHSKRQVLYRLDRLCSELGLDRERARGWTVAQTVAWSAGGDSIAEHVETVGWLLEDA
jgi:streptomycin 6-kinase